MPRHSTTTWRVYAPIAVWLAALVTSWGWMNHYEFGTNAPAAQGVVTHWPAGSKLTQAVGRPTLVLFLHPKCACSRASLAELERLSTSVDGAAPIEHALIVVATLPAGADDQWLDTDTVRRAQILSGAQLFVDRGGVEAARFGATTSGQVMLFNEAGICRYAGGVTLCRAHEGDNVGRRCIERILLGHRGSQREIPAFGCPLCLPDPPRGIGAAAATAAARSPRDSSLPLSGPS